LQPAIRFPLPGSHWLLPLAALHLLQPTPPVPRALLPILSILSFRPSLTHFSPFFLPLCLSLWPSLLLSLTLNFLQHGAL
ncbi:hypothetical protein CLOM_g13889, partial [Closterium sp. NIES-68]